jgi:hypothetical protein
MRVGTCRGIPVRHRRPLKGIEADAAYPQLGHAFLDTVEGRAGEGAICGIPCQPGVDLAEAEAPPACVPYLPYGFFERPPWIPGAAACFQPPVEPGFAHAQHPCHHRDAVVRLLLPHQPVPAPCQRLLAKKAAAFFRNSFSLSSSLMRFSGLPPGPSCST